MSCHFDRLKFLQTLALKLQEKRLLKGYTLAEVQRRIGIDPYFLIIYELGLRAPPGPYFYDLIKLYDFSMEDLLSVSIPNYKPPKMDHYQEYDFEPSL